MQAPTLLPIQPTGKYVVSGILDDVHFFPVDEYQRYGFDFMGWRLDAQLTIHDISRLLEIPLDMASKLELGELYPVGGWEYLCDYLAWRLKNEDDEHHCT